MAYPTKVTIRSGKTVYGGDPDGEGITSRRVEVSVTYALERSDDDLLASVAHKAQEVEAAHQTVWRQVRREQGELPLAAGPPLPKDAPEPDDKDTPEPDDKDTPEPDDGDDDPLRAYGEEDDEEGENGGMDPPFEDDPNDELRGVAPRGDEPTGDGPGDGRTGSNGAATDGNSSGPRLLPVTKPQKLAISAQARRLGLSDQALAETIRERYGKTSFTPRYAVERLTKTEAGDLLRCLAEPEWAAVRQGQPAPA